MLLGVVFTGASGTGKSSLARWAGQHFGFPLVPSSTAEAYREAGMTFADSFTDPVRLAGVQKDIYQKTAAKLRNLVFRMSPFVSERGPDVLAYTALLCHRSFLADEPCSDIDDICKRPDVLTVFVRPSPVILDAARAADGGRRNKFLSDEWVYRCDGAIAYHLERNAVPYITLDGDDWRGRTAAVMRAADAIRWTGWPPEPVAPKKKR